MTASNILPASEKVLPVSMIERVVEILDTFDGRSAITLAQVVNRSGLARSSVHRILEQLVAVKWLTREGTTYRLGVKMLELGALAVHQDVLHSAALPLMWDLNSLTNLTVHLAVMDDTEMIYLERIGGRFSSWLPSHIGTRAPAYCTSAGKAMLAFSDPDLVQSVIDSGLKAKTRFTITDRIEFERELQRIRERGVAFDREEGVRGVGCIGAPVRGPGRPIAAISICGPVREVHQRFAGVVQQAAHNIWRAVNNAHANDRPATEDSADNPWAPGELDAWSTWHQLTAWI